jgi:tetratricopeptide (TPR) repeat protein
MSAKHSSVRAWTEDVVIPTYLPHEPDKNPMFLEKRVYQGSSGKVYPLPYTDRIAEGRTDRTWKAVWLENEYLRLMILPEIGGRIHRAVDKTNGYDFLYHQHVIKPALVGLAGPWISGGIEMNWPQHHRPSTFMPADAQIEEHADGAVTVWLSEHDPMARMKGMHGVCLHPGRAYIELKVRVYNRTPLAQTFLWWANVATRVHEQYQSFFPPDVFYVADHAKRAMSRFPLCDGFYYGVDYGTRGKEGVPVVETPRCFVPPHCRRKGNGQDNNAEVLPQVDYAANDLTWYANIPVPTSYMCMGSQHDFFGGYDHAAQAGIVHVANHHISPGKKQWTWGNHEFGYAWDRNLTDEDGPYIELMAGVYTDNQPDFSHLQPGETKTWSQYWYPIQKIGVAQEANLQAAVSLELGPERFRIGVSVTSAFPGAVIRLERKTAGPLYSGEAAEWDADLTPGKPWVLDSEQTAKPWKVGETRLTVLDREGREIIAYAPPPLNTGGPRAEGSVPPPATEPLSPEEIASADELYITGLHLMQYRHATRCPTTYWREALRRDPLDSRCNNAMGLWHLRRGEFGQAESHFRSGVERLTSRNPNPADGEPFYNLGLCLRYRLDFNNSPLPYSGEGQGVRALFSEAYAAFYKATWNHAWQAAGYHAIAEMDCRRGDWTTALDHANRALQVNIDNLRARDLKALILFKLGQEADANLLLAETLKLDPLDWWAAHLLGRPLSCDTQVRLDLALDMARAGFFAESIGLLDAATPEPGSGTAPLVDYYRGWLQEKSGNPSAALSFYERAAGQSSDYCFPARLEEIGILEAAMRVNPGDSRAPYYLGNLLYDRRRYAESIAAWEASARIEPNYSVVWRNLGIAYYNVAHQLQKARKAYERAFRANPSDARLLYERDQLWKRMGEVPKKRLRALEKHLELVQQRDDLSIEFCSLLNQTGQHQRAVELLGGRRFQPWEGGEGLAIAQHVRAHLALGREALVQADPLSAKAHFEQALQSPPNLAEAKHLLANQSDIHYWLGMACNALGDKRAARRHWKAAATFRGDFQEMSVRQFSEMTWFSALAWGMLGRPEKKKRLLNELLSYAKRLYAAEARIDYFATSLPSMLLFEDDLQARQETRAMVLEAQARLGLGEKAKARTLLAAVLARDPNHPLAADLLKEIARHAIKMRKRK